MKRISLKTIFITLLFFSFFQNTYSQIVRKGLPLIYNYVIDDYKAHTQNWCILKGNNGIMYFGNNNCILEYDGIYWDTIYNSNNSTIRSLVTAFNDNVYVGAFNEIGYLSKDSTSGKNIYVSIMNKIPKEYQSFKEIWKLYYINKKIYACTFSQIMIIDSNYNVNVIKPKNKFHFTLKNDNKLYVRDEGIGMYLIENEKIKYIQNSEIFADDRIYAILPFINKQLLFVARKKGFFIHDGKKFKNWNFRFENDIVNKHIYHAIPINNDYYALSTLENGIYIIDNKGNLIQNINKKKGLKDNTVAYLYYDESNGYLWSALNIGISKILINSVYSVFDNRLGIKSQIQSVKKFNDKIYFGGTPYLFFSKVDDFAEPNIKNNYKTINESLGQTWKLFVHDNFLFATHSPDLIIIDKQDNISTLKLNENTWDIISAPTNNNELIVSADNGLLIIEKQTNKWSLKTKIKNFNKWARYIIVDKHKNIWAHVYTKGVYKLTLNNQYDSIIKKQLFTVNKGLNAFPNNLFYLNQNIIVPTLNGFYKYHTEIDSFKLYKELNNHIDSNMLTNNIFDDNDNNIWITNKDGSLVLIKPSKNNDNFDIIKKPFQRLKYNYDYLNFNTLDSNYFMINFSDKNYLINLKDYKERETKFKTIIKSIRIINTDSIYYFTQNDSNYTNQNIFANSDKKPHSFDYKHNSIQFNFGSILYNETKNILFNYKLDGFDKNWILNSSDIKKDYTNLPEGKYVFRVKATNIFNDNTNEAIFKFRIKPPWYRTLYAYIIYLLIIALLIYAAIVFYSKRLKQKNIQLEKIIKQRSDELVDQAIKFEQQEKEFKINFFTYISHEFRTPLTLILGYLEKFLTLDTLNEETKQQYLIMFRNGQQMLKLVNQLMDYRKTEEQLMKVKLQKNDMILFLKNISEFFNFLAHKNNINYTFQSNKSQLEIYFDHDKLEKIFSNLLSNAFKFTPESGKIDVEINSFNSNTKYEKKHGEPDLICGKNENENNFLEIIVEDSGIGISRDKLNNLFNKFYQAVIINPMTDLGSGLGLALTKNLVLLQGGDIQVYTTEGKGTRFIIHIPLLNNKLCSNKSDYVIIKGKNKTLNDKNIINDIADKKVNKTINRTTKNLKILVVEDNKDVRDFIKSILKNDYIIYEAGDGEEALQTARNILPNLIISDFKMPKMNGIQLCKEIKTNIETSHIPFILLSAYATVQHFVEGYESGADDYIEKPFNTRIFELLIKNRLLTRQKLKEKFLKFDLSDVKDIPMNSADKQFIEKAIKIVEANMHDFDFNVSVFVNKMAISKSLLHLKLKGLIGMPANEFIRLIRLKKAVELFKTKDMNISEIAYEVGFSNPKYFSQCFKEQFGILPSKIDFKNDDLDIVLTIKKSEQN